MSGAHVFYNVLREVSAGSLSVITSVRHFHDCFFSISVFCAKYRAQEVGGHFVSNE